MAIPRKRKIAEVSNNARIDSFYKPISKDSLKKQLVFNDENASQDTPSQQQNKDGNKKVFGDSSNKKPFGDNSNKAFGEQKSPLKTKVFGEQKQSVSKPVRQPLKEKSTKSSPSTFKIDKINKSTCEPAFEVLRDPDVEISQKDTSGLNTQFITESDTLCTQYTDVTSSPLDVFGDNDDNQEQDNEIYCDNQDRSPLVIYNDDIQDSPLTIYKDHSSPLIIYKDEDNNDDSPSEVYDNEEDSPLLIYKDEDNSCDSPLVIYNDEDENDQIQIPVCKDTNHRKPLAVKHNDENDSGLIIHNEQEEEDEPPFIIFRDEPTNTDVHKNQELLLFDENDEEDSLEKIISLDTKENIQSKELKPSSKNFFSDNYDEFGTTIDSSNNFFDEDDEDDQHDYADIVDSLNTNDFSVAATLSQESIKSTPPVVKSPPIRPISVVLGSKTFFSKFGSKK